MSKTFTLRIVALTVVFGGGVFGWFTVRAGPAGFLVGAFYTILIVPLMVILLAKEREILVWQVCLVTYALAVAVARAPKHQSILFYILMALIPWFLGNIASGIQVLTYVGRSKGHEAR